LFYRDYIRGRPKGAIEKSTYVCESRYVDQGKNIVKIKNWPQSLPESIRNVELELELFDTPLVPNRVASAFADQIVKKEEKVEEKPIKKMPVILEKKEVVDMRMNSQFVKPVPSPVIPAPTRQAPVPVNTGPVVRGHPQINPIYYHQIGFGPGENLNEKTGIFKKRINP
jgi:hypothetical protein